VWPSFVHSRGYRSLCDYQGSVAIGFDYLSQLFVSFPSLLTLTLQTEAAESYAFSADINQLLSLSKSRSILHE
jgi:hypothetical protein